MAALSSLSPAVFPPTSKTTSSSPVVGSGTLAWTPRLPAADADSAQKAEEFTALSYFLIQAEMVIALFDAGALRNVASGISAAVNIAPVPKSRAVSPA